MRIALAALACVIMCLSASAQTVKRGRGEGPLSVTASNVAGNGNITLFAQPAVNYSIDGLRFDPIVGGLIGISDIMQIGGQIVPIGQKGLGPIEAHLQITLPGNERLRFFGIAVMGDLFLSTMIDTISLTADRTKPEYKPFLLPSLAIDLDWIALFKTVPLKTYLFVGMADNPLLLYRYNQISARLALEYKMFAHALWAGVGTGLYQEKLSRISPVGDRSYEQYCAYATIGGRYRILDWLSLVGDLRVTLVQQIKKTLPLSSDLMTVSLRLEAPLLFRETNTEAIRTLVFMEQVKEKKSITGVTAAGGSSGENDVLGALGGSIGTLGNDESQSFDYSAERDELVKRREETQAKMLEIEQMFNEVSGPVDTTALDSMEKLK